jgi:hypothetical protein
MRTITSLAADSPRASIPGLDAATIVSQQSVRRGYTTRVDERASVEPQTVDIWVDRGYQPAQTVAAADAPLRIVFHRRDADHCTERVVFSSPHIERRLAANGTTAVDLPAQPPGVVRFTCGMGRYRGEIALIRRRTTLGRRARVLGSLAADVAGVTLLAGTGILPVDVAAGVGAFIAGAIALGVIATRSIGTRFSRQY